jgi:hypothetical protein
LFCRLFTVARYNTYAYLVIPHLGGFFKRWKKARKGLPAEILLSA